MERKNMKSLALVLLVLAMLVLTACTTNYSQEELDVQLAELEATKQGEIDALDTELSALSEDNLALESNVASNEAKIAELEGQIEDLETPEEEEVEAIVEEVETEVLDNLEFGSTVEFNIDDSELSKLIDSELEFDGDDYDVHEEFLGYDTLIIALNGYGYDEEFSGEPYLVLVDEGALEYRYVFDDPINMTDISDEEPLEIVFLGEPLKIVEANADELKVEFGIELLLNINEPYLYENLELTLFGVGDDEAFIGYNDDTESIDEGQTKDVGGLDVKVIDVFESDIGEGYGFAKVVIGSEVEKTLESNDEYLEDERFEFVIESTGDDLEALVILYDVKSDELDDEYAPLALGEVITFPNDFLTVEFAELTTVDYINFEVYFDEFDAEDDLVSDENGFVLEAGDSVIEIDNDEFEEVYFLASGIYYEDDEGDFTLASDSEAVIVNDDFEYEVSLSGETLVFTDELNDELEVVGDFAGLFLGLEEEDAEAGDVVFGELDFGTMDYDLLLGSGVIVLDLENNADNDEVKFAVPSELVEATVLVY